MVTLRRGSEESVAVSGFVTLAIIVGRGTAEEELRE
jgi:hypothetical protein